LLYKNKTLYWFPWPTMVHMIMLHLLWNWLCLFFDHIHDICVHSCVWNFDTTTTGGYFAIQISSQTTKKEIFESPLSQTLNLLWYHNICTRTIASPSQLPNLIKSQNFFDYNCFYTLFAINTTSETICNKPIITTT
jgi:hypothetical protein